MNIATISNLSLLDSPLSGEMIRKGEIGSLVGTGTQNQPSNLSNRQQGITSGIMTQSDMSKGDYLGLQKSLDRGSSYQGEQGQEKRRFMDHFLVRGADSFIKLTNRCKNEVQILGSFNQYLKLVKENLNFLVQDSDLFTSSLKDDIIGRIGDIQVLEVKRETINEKIQELEEEIGIKNLEFSKLNEEGLANENRFRELSKGLVEQKIDIQRLKVEKNSSNFKTENFEEFEKISQIEEEVSIQQNDICETIISTERGEEYFAPSKYSKSTVFSVNQAFKVKDIKVDYLTLIGLIIVPSLMLPLIDIMISLYNFLKELDR